MPEHVSSAVTITLTPLAPPLDICTVLLKEVLELADGLNKGQVGVRILGEVLDDVSGATIVRFAWPG